MPALLLKLLPGIMSAIGKLLGPLAIYLKGRSEGIAKQKAKSNEEFIRRVDAGADARAGKLPDEHKDPANRDNG